jgi:thiol-disulfide isomerase/thioredoxin
MQSRRVPLPVLVGATVLVVAGVVAFFVVSRSSGGDHHDWPSAEKVRATELTALGNGARDTKLGQLLAGRPMVVNFFAKWCNPCQREMPAFEKVHGDLGDQVAFVGISEDLQAGDGRAMAQRTGVTYPTYIDKAQGTLLFFKGLAMPTTVFIDADGTIVDVDTGKMDAAELRHKIDDHFRIGA